MTSLLERCAGSDVHQAVVMATVRIPDGSRGRSVITETFATTTHSLLTLRDWLHAHGVAHVAMESTGVYWKRVYYVLEDGFTLLLVNAQHLKLVPGRKSDVRDSAWIAQLLECGFAPEQLRAAGADSRPPRADALSQASDAGRTREVNRLHRVLEDAIKLSSVATDVMGASGTAMLQALVAGTTDP
jgi:transposase